jgi:hypothetical protein
VFQKPSWELGGRWLVGILCLLMLVGCSKGDKDVAPVKGKVTYKGKAITQGTVMFQPTGGGPAAQGNLLSDGTYKLGTYKEDDGAVIGTHKVAIIALADLKGMLPEQQALPPPIIPDKYLSQDTSGLQAEVKSGDNEINFDLPD